MGTLCHAAQVAENVPVVYETKADRHADTDSVAVYRTGAEAAWLFATEKAGDTVAVFDAVSGKLLGRLGGKGDGPGELRRPNGIAVATVPVAAGPRRPVLLVVERNGRRVQAFALPGREPLGTFGREELRTPYGVATAPSEGSLLVFVTDVGAPLAERVRRYRLAFDGERLLAAHERSFGEAEGKGRLSKVESIAADPELGRLYVCDEGSVRNVKVYGLDGKFLGRTFGDGVVLHEAEGLAIWRRGREGYIVLSDQGPQRTYFRVFDRASLDYVGTFTSRIANTDGICLVQEPVGAWAKGILYAVHNDGPVRGCAWADIAAALRLSLPGRGCPP
jgi:3-phytase